MHKPLPACILPSVLSALLQSAHPRHCHPLPHHHPHPPHHPLSPLGPLGHPAAPDHLQLLPPPGTQPLLHGGHQQLLPGYLPCHLHLLGCLPDPVPHHLQCPEHLEKYFVYYLLAVTRLSFKRNHLTLLPNYPNLNLHLS